MKIILTGATGFVGSTVLAHLIDDSRITQVTCITRRPLATNDAKVAIIMKDDFTSYDPAQLSYLASHDACIWALGGKASDLGDAEDVARVTCDFTLVLAQGVAARLRHPFSFCYLSGMGADPSETAWFPWQRLTRHLKGRTEFALQALQDRKPAFCAHAYRPGGILRAEDNGLLRYGLAPLVVDVEALADAMIAGATDQRLFGLWPIVGNAAIKRFADGRLPEAPIWSLARAPSPSQPREPARMVRPARKRPSRSRPSSP